MQMCLSARKEQLLVSVLAAALAPAAGLVQVVPCAAQTCPYRLEDWAPSWNTGAHSLTPKAATYPTYKHSCLPWLSCLRGYGSYSGSCGG